MAVTDVDVFPCTGFGIKNMDRQVLLAVFDTLQNHYPERMGSDRKSVV